MLAEEGPKTKYVTEITYNIDRMCIRHHTHWSVESVAERGAAAPSLSSVRGRGRQGVETRTARVSAQGLWKIHRSSLVLFKGSFKDHRYCSLGFFRGPREEAFEQDSGPCNEGTVR